MRHHSILVKIGITILFISQISFSQEKGNRYELTSETKKIISRYDFFIKKSLELTFRKVF